MSEESKREHYERVCRNIEAMNELDHSDIKPLSYEEWLDRYEVVESGVDALKLHPLDLGEVDRYEYQPGEEWPHIGDG